MKQSKSNPWVNISIQRTSFDAVKTHGKHLLSFDGDGKVLQLHLETKDAAKIRLRKNLPQEVAIKHSSGPVDMESQSLKKLFVYGAIVTSSVIAIREPLPLFLLAATAATASFLFFKPTVRLIFDFADNDAFIVAEVPSETAAELLA